MVPADDDPKDTPEVDSSASTKECKSSHLTPMPGCLMHWWIPFVLAAFLFLGSMFITSIWGSATFDEIMHAIQDCPKRWPFHMRTPSREEIEVCLTITAAGFAFSAWQQRSHDNAIREEERTKAQQQAEKEQKRQEHNRLEQIERDEYWKRREHILHTLDSNNPGIRLAAVSLLAELADSAAHSGQLNHTAQQQLQQHIISTLCLQMRHEGQLIESEGTKEDHIGIQSEILEVIFRRVDPADQKDLLANWSMEVLNFRNVNFYTEFKMIDRKTQCTIVLTGAVFHENATFSGCTIHKLVWHKSSFMKQLTFHSQRKENTPGTIVSHDNFPKYISYGDFKGIAFCKDESTEGIDHRINIRASNKSDSSDYDDINYLNFSECTFLHTISTFHKASNSPVAYRRTEGKSILDKTQLPENYTWGILRIEQINYSSTPTHERDTGLRFDRCTFEKVTVDSGLTHSNTEFTSCYFASLAFIAIMTANRSSSFEDQDHIIFEDCIFAMSSNFNTPIKLVHVTNGNSGLIPRTFFRLRDNQAHIQNENGQPIFQTLELTGTTIGERYLKIGTETNHIPFEERNPSI
ncbi:hypothetical protein FBF35_08255 [Schaalia odontolytica]|uniref:hypothetical protein n=1 Tax=Schaalia odontolytica TaxID=1660 RepID=UPI000A8F679E|nr:hypothetical protein [Schaalia odontolytica]QCT36005.1 hypothetical protein FBF35_08255 [Schaalia odontolytica]